MTALAEDREFLIAKGQLEQDVADWQRRPTKRRRAHCLRATNSLAPVTGSSSDRRTSPPTNASSSRQARTLRRPAAAGCRMAAAIAGIVIVGFAAFAGLQWRKAEERSRVAIANESRALVALSRKAELDSKPVEAIKLALASWPREPRSNRPFLE